MKNIYKYLLIMISCIIYKENSYTAQNINYPQGTAMSYFHENMEKNQMTTRNIQNLMLNVPIDSIDRIIYQSKISLTDNNRIMIQEALKSTLKALNGAIADVKFDINQNATILSYFNPISYFYGHPVEKELIKMKKQVERRLHEDDLLSTPQKSMKAAYNYASLSAKLATGAAALIAAVYAGINYNETKAYLHDVAYNKTFADIFLKSAEAVKTTVPDVIKATTESSIEVFQAAVQ